MEKNKTTSADLMPALVFLSDKANVPHHSHESYELLFMLSGQISLYINEEHFIAGEGDLILINKQTIHAYKTDGECMHIVCQIDINQLPTLPNTNIPFFRVNSVKYPHTTRYNHLRHLLAKLIEVQAQEDHNTGSMGVIYEIVSELLMHFTTSENTPAAGQGAKHIERRVALLNYVTENYRDALTLNALASSFNLSVPYLSSFFKKHIGVTFTEYYNRIRLERTTKELIGSDEPIDVIAQNNGFSDTRTFVKLFKDQFNILPSHYRKSVKDAKPFPEAKSRGGNVFHPSLSKSAYHEKLVKYKETPAAELNVPCPASSEAAIAVSCGTLLLSKETITQNHDFIKICFVENLNSLLETNTQNTLRDLQTKIGFDFLSFDILSYLENQAAHQDNPQYFHDFYFIDQILDFLISIRLKPMFTMNINHILIQNEKKDLPLPLYRFILPKNNDAFCEKLEILSAHILSQYGVDMAKNWSYRIMFNVIEPNTVFESQEDFLTFYRSIYGAIKKADPVLQIGSHALSMIYPEDHERNTDFIKYCHDHHCLPDYFNFLYSDRLVRKADISLSGPQSSDNYLERFFDKIEAYKAECKIADIPAYICEYNTMTAHNNSINDTCYKSCYITQNILKNLGRSQMTGFWKLTDSMHTLDYPSALFHGGLGLYTYNWIAKPHFHAVSFISKLGKEILANEDGWIATRNQNRLVLMFYNYEFYKHSISHNEDYSNRHSPFQQMKSICFSLKFDQIDGDYYIMRQYCVNQNHGSSFDIWLKLGSPTTLSKSCVDFIRNIQPDALADSGKINNGILNLEVTLEPLEIRLIEIDIYSRG